MTCVSLVRIGPIDDNVTGSILRNAILDHFAKKTGEDFSELPHRLRVVNRYFEASVILRDVVKDKQELDAPLAEDGIILVFDAAKSNPDYPTAMAASFDSMDRIHDSATQQGAGDLLRLCVGVTIGKCDASEIRGKDHEKEYSRRILWCLDRGYEYVEADLSEEGLLMGHDERDKEGFARIVEAIGGTVWSSAIMGSTKKKELKQSFAETKERHDFVADDYVPPDPSMLGPAAVPKEEYDGVREEKAREALLMQAKPGVCGGFLQENVDPATGEERIEENEQERLLDNFENVVREAARIREVSRAGVLTDDERRARAGDAAMLLMDLMGKLGANDEDEEDSIVTEEGEDISQEA